MTLSEHPGDPDDVPQVLGGQDHRENNEGGEFGS